MLYVIVNPDGSQQRVGPLAMEPETGQQLLVFADLTDEPSSLSHTWNTVTRVWDAIVPPVPPTISRTKLTNREFLQRLDVAGVLNPMLSVLATPLTENSTPQEHDLLVECMKFDRYLTNSDGVDLTHQKVQEATGLFQMVGWCTTDEATAILAPSTVAEE